jgi:glutamate formiminotransferase
VIECVPNVSEGRDETSIGKLSRACGAALLDVHRDADHHRSVFTLAGPEADDAIAAVRSLARAVARLVDLGAHAGVHPRFGALDVVPFVALDGTTVGEAARAAQEFASWWSEAFGVPCASSTATSRRTQPRSPICAAALSPFDLPTPDGRDHIRRSVPQPSVCGPRSSR